MTKEPESRKSYSTSAEVAGAGRELTRRQDMMLEISHCRSTMFLHTSRRTMFTAFLPPPPCTEFSVLNCKAEARKRNPQEGLKIVMACLRIIEKSKPVWWALENPVGFLREYMGKSALIFHPWQYGDPWTKRTELWGTFTIPEKKIHELGRCSKQATSLHQTGTGKTKFCLSPQIRAGPYTTACLGQPENRRRFSGDYSSGICASVF